MGLQYNKIATNDGEILLSPSSIAQMFDNEGKWYSTYIKGENKFSGNDNTYLGTLLHARIEAFYNNEWLTKEDELEYLEQNNAIDQWKIMEDLELMYKGWLEQYGKKNPKPNILEQTYTFKPAEDIVIGGTVDAIMGDALIDWKSSSKSKSSISEYKMQMYSYYFVIESNRKKIESMTEEECEAYYKLNYI